MMTSEKVSCVLEKMSKMYLGCFHCSSKMLTHTYLNEYGKYRKLMTTDHVLIRCTGRTAYGDPCRRYANGCLDGSFVCRAHFKPMKPRKRKMKVIEMIVCTEDECPVCLEEFIPFAKSKCGHSVCSACCRGMKDTGRTLVCPLCRDARFKDLVDMLLTV